MARLRTVEEIPETCAFCDELADHLFVEKKEPFFADTTLNWSFLCEHHARKINKGEYFISRGQLKFIEQKVLNIVDNGSDRRDTDISEEVLVLVRDWGFGFMGYSFIFYQVLNNIGVLGMPQPFFKNS